MVRAEGPVVGILALQGGFAAHQDRLAQLGANVRLIRRARDLAEVRGLIIPGGESSTFLKLLDPDLKHALTDLFKTTAPVLTTCAGTILVASEVTNPSQESFGLIDISVTRNAYGRQIDSFVDAAANWSATGRAILEQFDFPPATIDQKVETVFIRAPTIDRVGKDVAVLLEVGDRPVLVQHRHILAATFHPELSERSTVVHELFLRMIPQA